MTILISSIIIIVFLGCEKNESKVSQQALIDLGVLVHYVDNDGTDLLDSSKVDSYKSSGMRLYFMSYGNKVEVPFNSMLDMPRGFKVEKSERNGSYVVNTLIYCGDTTNLLNNAVNTVNSVTYLQLDEKVTDTIKCEIRRRGSVYMEVQKLWYNGELKWSLESNIPREITIEKHGKILK